MRFLCAYCCGRFPIKARNYGAVQDDQIDTPAELLLRAERWSRLTTGMPMLFATVYAEDRTYTLRPAEMFAVTVVAGTYLCGQHAAEQLAKGDDRGVPGN